MMDGPYNGAPIPTSRFWLVWELLKKGADPWNRLHIDMFYPPIEHFPVFTIKLYHGWSLENGLHSNDSPPCLLYTWDFIGVVSFIVDYNVQSRALQTSVYEQELKLCESIIVGDTDTRDRPRLGWGRRGGFS